MAVTTGRIVRFALRGVLFLALANCIAAQIAISDCVASECESNTDTDSNGAVRNQCCAYLQINNDRCCSVEENNQRQLYFNLVVGLSVAIGALIVIILVIVCICVCCCCC